MKTVLVNLSVFHAASEILPVAEFFVRAGWRVVVLIGYEGKAADALEAECLQKRMIPLRAPSGIGYGAPAGGKTPPPSVKSPRFPGLRRALGLIPEFVGHLSFMRASKKYAASVLELVKPDVFISNNFHSCGRLDNALLALCKQADVVCACITVSPHVSRQFALNARIRNFQMGMVPASYGVGHDWLNGVFARLFPGWTHTDQGVSLFCFHPVQILAAKLSGLLPGDIWETPARAFDRVFVPGEFSKKILRLSGYPEEKIRVSGPPRLDPLLAGLKTGHGRHAVLRRLRLDEEQPFILLNVEPSWEHHYCPRERHWSNFRSLTDTLARQGLPVVLSLHPLCNIDDYAFIEADETFRISRELKIEHLYPHCALAVSFPCSTNAYAQYFCKPLIVYDWFGMRTSATLFHERFCCGPDNLATSPEELDAVLRRTLGRLCVGGERPPAGNEAASERPCASETIFRTLADARANVGTKHE